MKRLFVASLLSLATAGCAQSRSALSNGDGAPPGPAKPGPVAVAPVPSVYDTINPGLGGPALARTAMKDPNDPQWSGRARVASTAAPTGSNGSNPASGASAAQAQSLDPRAPAPAELSLQPARSGQPVAAAAPAPSAATASASGSSGGQASSLPQAAASRAEPAGAEVPAAGAPSLAPAPANAARTTSTGPAATDAGGMPVDSRATLTQPLAGLPAAASAAPSAAQSPMAPVAAPAAQPPITPAAAQRTAAPGPGRDPLLGPDPDLMPPMPDLAEVKLPGTPAAPPGLALPGVTSSGRPGSSPGPALPAVTSPGRPAAPLGVELPAAKSTGDPPSLRAPEASAAKSSTSVAPPPADLPLEPASSAPPAAVNPAGDSAVLPKAGAGATAPAAQPAGADKSTAAREPASAGSLAAPPPLEPAPALDNVSPAVSARAAVPGPAPPHRDPQVVRTSAKVPEGDPTDRRRLSLEPGCPIARVGDEIITYHDLVLATRESLSRFALPRGKEFDSAHQIEMANQINMLKMDALDGLIERSMLFQEAKRHIKDPKILARVYEEADKIWHDNEILPLEREYNVDNEQQLQERLAARGRSLESMRQGFRQLYLSRSFLHEKLKDKVNVELPDLLRYYNEHVDNHKFDCPAQIKWRELLVEVPKYESREAARRKADGLLASLQQGADFAKLARAQSDGLSSSRNRGGLMETSPGGYAVVPVNRAIESLPIGQVSGVIEGPDSFHIVKVESRRAAGPATFEEVQDKIKPVVQNQKFQAESAAYINKLRRSTPITIYSPKKTKNPKS